MLCFSDLQHNRRHRILWKDLGETANELHHRRWNGGQKLDQRNLVRQRYVGTTHEWWNRRHSPLSFGRRREHWSRGRWGLRYPHARPPDQIRTLVSLLIISRETPQGSAMIPIDQDTSRIRWWWGCIFEPPRQVLRRLFARIGALHGVRLLNALVVMIDVSTVSVGSTRTGRFVDHDDLLEKKSFCVFVKWKKFNRLLSFLSNAIDDFFLVSIE